MSPTPSRLRALKRAQHFIGTKEDPPGSNHGQLVDHWQREATGTTGYPWCAAFMWSMFENVGLALKIRYPAAVFSWVDYADTRGLRVVRPLRGDLVAYSWNGRTNHPRDHIGIVEKVLGLPSVRTGKRYYIRTVEGNVGDAVRRKWRLVDPRTVVFIRIPG